MQDFGGETSIKRPLVRLGVDGHIILGWIFQ